MMDDEDMWLDALAGRPVADAHQPAAYEGRGLREAMLRQRQPVSAAAPARDAQRELALLARAEREGLIDPSRRIARARWARLASRPGLLAYAAALTFLAVALTWFSSPTQQSERVRGVVEGTVTLEAADPKGVKRELLDQLHAAGVPATGYERFGVQGIDADLPQPVPEPVKAVLQKHHIDLPKDGVLKVEIAPADTP